ncbi:MAG: hypothetical protein HY835_03565, partial [Anaerolineae bacterium]|nr:hypothetical protein [Anaerolineae bacterium]
IVVFLLQAGLLVVSVILLARIDVPRFRSSTSLTASERAAMLNDAG